jgi:inosine/xanthosine triphosphate pyrophosphatase family protein
VILETINFFPGPYDMRYSGTDMSAEEIGKALNCIGGIVV